MANELGNITQVGGTVTAPKYNVTDQGTGVQSAVVENGTTNAAGFARGGLGTTSPSATWDVRGHNGNSPVIQARLPVKSYTITNRSRTSNVATVTIGNHGFVVSEQIAVTGVSDATFNVSSNTITAVTATTVSYTNTGSDVASTSSTGTASVVTTADLQRWVNQSNVTVASVGYTGIVTGIGSGLTALNGSNVSTGTVALARGGTGGSSAVTGIDNLMTQGTTILGAATTDLSTATGQFVVITNSGTPTITSFGTLAAGAERVLQFSGAATITHNATSLILPGGASITVANNDRMTLRSLGSGNWLCIDYIRASAPPVSGTNTGDQTITLTGDVTGSGTGSFATTIGSNKVTSAMFRQSTGLSVVGNPASGSANVSDISAAVTGGVLQSNGTTLSFALVGNGNISNTSIDLSTKVTGVLPATSFPALTGDVTTSSGSVATTLKAVNSFTSADPALADLSLGYDTSATANRQFQVDRLLGLARMAPGGRLTLLSGSPVTVSDLTGITTVRYTPYQHDMACLWDGTRWVWGVFAETSLALGTLTSGKNYDVFAYLSSGTFTLESLAWTSDTGRATAITIQDGRYCKSGDKTRLYLGTFRTTSTTTTEDSANKRFLFNMYNRVPRKLAKYDSTSSWTYGPGVTNTWRNFNNTANNRCEWVDGTGELAVELMASCRIFAVAGSNNFTRLGIGIDVSGSTTPTRATIAYALNLAYDCNPVCQYNNYPGVGYHFAQVQEYIFDSAASATFVGTGDGQGGIQGLLTI